MNLGPIAPGPGLDEALSQHDWPGNLRELQNVIRHGLSRVKGAVLTVADVAPDLREVQPASLQLPASAGAPPGDQGEIGPFFKKKEEVVDAFERAYLERILTMHRGDVAAAARMAQMPLGTFYRLLRKHSMRPERFRR